MNHNQLESLPERIGDMNLSEVYLYHNKLFSLPESFGNLTELVHIRFDNTFISEFPPQLLKLNKVESINFTDSLIDILPEEILKLNSLELLAFREATIDRDHPLNAHYDEVVKKLYDRGVAVYLIDYENLEEQ